MTETNWKELKVEKLEFAYEYTDYRWVENLDGEKTKCWMHSYKILINGLDTGFTLLRSCYGCLDEDDEISSGAPHHYHNEEADFTEAHKEVGKILGIPEEQFPDYYGYKGVGYPTIVNVDLSKKKVDSGVMVIYRIELSDGQVVKDHCLYSKDDDIVFHHSARNFATFVLGLEGLGWDVKMANLGMGESI